MSRGKGDHLYPRPKNNEMKVTIYHYMNPSRFEVVNAAGKVVYRSTSILKVLAKIKLNGWKVEGRPIRKYNKK